MDDQVVSMASAVHYVHPDKPQSLGSMKSQLPRPIKREALGVNSFRLCLLVGIRPAAARRGSGPRKTMWPLAASMQPSVERNS
jgi:hypothetical protein